VVLVILVVFECAGFPRRGDVATALPLKGT
jgi:hypothetical protein